MGAGEAMAFTMGIGGKFRNYFILTVLLQSLIRPVIEWHKVLREYLVSQADLRSPASYAVS